MTTERKPTGALKKFARDVATLPKFAYIWGILTGIAFCAVFWSLWEVFHD